MRFQMMEKLTNCLNNMVNQMGAETIKLITRKSLLFKGMEYNLIKLNLDKQ